MFGNSTSSMSSRSLNRARPCCDIDSVTRIFFLLLAILFLSHSALFGGIHHWLSFSRWVSSRSTVSGLPGTGILRRTYQARLPLTLMGRDVDLAEAKTVMS